jgi:hypothetical protein
LRGCERPIREPAAKDRNRVSRAYRIRNDPTGPLPIAATSRSRARHQTRALPRPQPPPTPHAELSSPTADGCAGRRLPAKRSGTIGLPRVLICAHAARRHCRLRFAKATAVRVKHRLHPSVRRCPRLPVADKNSKEVVPSQGNLSVSPTENRRGRIIVPLKGIDAYIISSLDPQSPAAKLTLIIHKRHGDFLPVRVNSVLRHKSATPRRLRFLTRAATCIALPVLVYADFSTADADSVLPSLRKVVRLSLTNGRESRLQHLQLAILIRVPMRAGQGLPG